MLSREKIRDLYTEYSEIAFLTGAFPASLSIGEKAIALSSNALEAAKIYRLRILALMAANKPVEAVKAAREYLKQLGRSFPLKRRPFKMTLQFWVLKLKLLGKDDASIINMRKMEKEADIVTMSIMQTIFPLLHSLLLICFQTSCLE
ncbi:MAG: hypothetical protein ACLFR1_01250 [Spirochaetia bacterium]